MVEISHGGQEQKLFYSYKITQKWTKNSKSFQKKAFCEEKGNFLPKEMVIDTEKLIDVMTCQYVFVEIY